MKLPSFLTGQAWKLATGGAVLVVMVMTALLMSTCFKNRDLVAQRNALSASINDPKTGFIAQLAQAHTNVETLKHTVEVQNVAIDKLGAESQARLAATRAELAKAQAETRVMEKKLAGFLATGPKGATLEDRVRDIDERAMKEFLP